TDPAAGLARVLAVMGPQAHKIDHMDGSSCDMGQWRFNLRCSNTEALVRLNVEVRNDIHLLDDCIQQVETVLQGRRTPH
ncbi:MAG: phosphomannomutase, partial [Planktomarina sp.]